VSDLEVRLLGPFEVIVAGKPVEVRGAKRQALVAFLALRAGRVVATDSLVDALWGSDLPAAPRNAVQHHVNRLRRALGPEAIRLAPDGYALEGAVVDTFQFEELLAAARAALRAGDPRSATDTIAAALALSRGPPLLGLPDSAWARAEAGRLEALRFDALEEQFEAALALGEHAEIEPAVRAGLEESPFRERLWGQLMLALYRSGRQADALEAFQEARRVLSEELALEPGPELRRLQQAILAQDAAIAPVPVAPPRRGNLPTPVTSFVGREEDLAQVLRLVSEHRLVTLCGPPGVGKSRLALEAMHSLEGEAWSGIWLVDLTRARADEDVPRVLADVLEDPGTRGSRDPLERALACLGDHDGVTIVILDNCARVLEGARRTASAILEASPAVRVLATSRQLLQINGEAQHRLSPLAVPGAEVEGLDELTRSEAVRLFAERARAVRPGFELREGPDLVADVCRRLDGLPLAIELAAARMNVFGLGEIRSLLERRFAPHDRNASDAARGLEEVLAWSYDLLHADEKTLLHQLAVHRGGAPLPALVVAGAVHRLDEATVIQLLGALVDKSIVVVSFPTGAARYDLLDTVREYAVERLAETGGLVAAQRAHAEYFAALADAARTELRGSEWKAGVSRLGLEHDNLWAALAYARDAADPSIAIRLAALAWYFTLAERVSEGRRFVELALAAAADETPLEVRLEVAAFICYLQTEELDLDGAIETSERALALVPDGATPPQSGLLQAVLALALMESGKDELAAALAEEAYTAVEASGDDWSIAAASLLRAQIAAPRGDVSTVAAMAAQAHRHAVAIGFDAFQVPAMLLEAWVAERRNDGKAAADAYQQALRLAGRAGFRDHSSFALAGLGANALASGDQHEAEGLARRALAAAEAARASWAAAHARVLLGRVSSLTGDRDSAERLYRSVVEWSERKRPHQARETLFLALAGSPGAAALADLAELADAQGEHALADELRERAAVRAELDGAPLERVAEQAVAQ
jgi:predicted ATPase/DNA-binding SARP family transcriptional activator